MLFVAVIAIFNTACDGGKADKKVDSKIEEKPTTEVKEVQKEEIPESVSLVILGNDQMKFDLDELEVYEGQKVTLTLKHSGKMPKEVMGHNWVLLQSGVKVSQFANAAMSAKETDYVPADKMSEVIAYTKLIGGGEEVTIEFVAPSKGSYDYICSFPGHYSIMKGKLIVK